MRYGDINDEAFRWTASTESIGLGFLPGDNFSQANAVDADGSVVVGESGGKGIYHAFIWTPATGMLSLQDLLVADGVNVVGWSDLIATGVSADGKVIVGNGVDPLGYNEAWIANLPLSGTALFGVSDPFNDPIKQYDFWDSGSGGGHFVLNGVALGANQDNYVSAAQLPQVTYQSGSGPDTMWVRVTDGNEWSAWSQSFTITAPTDTGPIVTSISNINTIAGQTFAASSLFTASDPFNDPIQQCEFWDTGSGGGRFLLNGQPLGTNQDNYILGAQLQQTSYIAGSGTDTLWVRVSEGGQWSPWSPSFTVSDPTTIGADETLELSSAYSGATIVCR
jgi:probable HAF family extracellular repeat protein